MKFKNEKNDKIIRNNPGVKTIVMSMEQYLNQKQVINEKQQQTIESTPKKNGMSKVSAENNDPFSYKTKITQEELNKLQKKPLYKGQLAYIREFILPNNQEVTKDLIAKRLDVPLPLAQQLLEDSQK
ncbi:MAG: hypothetical protein U9O98_00850 [Asgard group archaeon]|nr:hypothetical protein [Asgard group archaeon]